MALGPDQDMTLSLINCLLLPTFRSQAAIVSKISIVFTFSQVQAYVDKTGLIVKLVKVNPGPSFEKLQSGVLVTTYNLES